MPLNSPVKKFCIFSRLTSRHPFYPYVDWETEDKQSINLFIHSDVDNEWHLSLHIANYISNYEMQELPSNTKSKLIKDNEKIIGSNIYLTQTHHVDSMEPDNKGNYEYYYEYDIYHFTDKVSSIYAKSYVDEPDEVSFTRFESNGEGRLLTSADFELPLLHTAISYLRKHGKLKITWLDQNNKINGYSCLPSNTK